MSHIDRSTEGLIEFQFATLEQLQDNTDLSIKDRIKLGQSLVSGIRQVASLELQHKRFIAKVPEFAKSIENRAGLRLVTTKPAEDEPAEEEPQAAAQ